jgi:hypothetical protein
LSAIQERTIPIGEVLWIKAEECSHLTTVIVRELEANGYQIVKKAS